MPNIPKVKRNPSCPTHGSMAIGLASLLPTSTVPLDTQSHQISSPLQCSHSDLSRESLNNTNSSFSFIWHMYGGGFLLFFLMTTYSQAAWA